MDSNGSFVVLHSFDSTPVPSFTSIVDATKEEFDLLFILQYFSTLFDEGSDVLRKCSEHLMHCQSNPNQMDSIADHLLKQQQGVETQKNHLSEQNRQLTKEKINLRNELVDLEQKVFILTQELQQTRTECVSDRKKIYLQVGGWLKLNESEGVDSEEDLCQWIKSSSEKLANELVRQRDDIIQLKDANSALVRTVDDNATLIQNQCSRVQQLENDCEQRKGIEREILKAKEQTEKILQEEKTQRELLEMEIQNLSNMCQTMQNDLNEARTVNAELRQQIRELSAQNQSIQQISSPVQPVERIPGNNNDILPPQPARTQNFECPECTPTRIFREYNTLQCHRRISHPWPSDS